MKQLSKVGVVLLAWAYGSSVWAAVSGLGTFTLDGGTSVPISQGGSVSGRYVAADGGGTGRFTLTMNASNGYTLPATVTGGSNGLMIFNDQNNNSNDKFSYTLSLTPDNPTLINTVKITQTPTGYSQVDGNSELARQTLSYTNDAATGGTALAIVANNPAVPLFYNAMGDMFMGADGGFEYGPFGGFINRYYLKSNYNTGAEQLRSDSNNSFYYYKFSDLTFTDNGARVTNNTDGTTIIDFDLWNRNQRFSAASDINLSWKSGSVGYLPSTNLADVLQLTTSAKPTALTEGSIIANGSSYLSYGVQNAASRYLIHVKNPKSVTLTYQGIMNGTVLASGNITGETVREWITFGIESTAPKYYIAGKVFNDGNKNAQLDANESGIAGARIALTDCNGKNIAVGNNSANPTTSAADGGYSFVLDSLPTNKNVCLVETNTPNYPSDTTKNTIALTLASDKYEYKDNHFGDTTKENGLLVLEKYHQIVDCNAPSLRALDGGFVQTAQTAKGQTQCIAYRIKASNTGRLTLDNIVITDKLPHSNDRTSILRETPKAKLCIGGILDNNCSDTQVKVSTDSNTETTIYTQPFTLAPSGQPNSIAYLYFNTLYQIR
ncbi:hypothetical protein [Faucicola atlantae]|uniref:DUF11 domain-containing protein n=1 Tax=Faucicola atlantae TaxID=34059 RepID=A0A1B8QA15_9GAMM|nr:hypothetical protein [Moraxella atlantae]OBX75957.1 hypothetical protein A9306_01690 [Moraxella atlantae]